MRTVDHPDRHEGCYHCGLPVVDPGVHTLPVDDTHLEFCCRGCLMAYQWIHAAGLEEFYRRREGQEGARPAVEGRAAERVLAYDTPAFHDRYVRTDDQGLSEVSLFLEGIHCAACVWLNEKVLASIPGVQRARVNFATHRATVLWDCRLTPLSTIVTMLQRIGYHAEPYDPDLIEGHHSRRNRDLLIRLGVAGFGAANVMLLAVALYAGYFHGIDPHLKNYFHWIAWGIATPVVFYSGWVFHRDAWHGLRAGRLTMDLPISLGALVTYGYSVWVMLSGTGEVYFETVATFVFVLLTGRYLESTARRRAADASERLLRLEPRVATVLRDGVECVVATRDVQVGECLLVRPGERIPVDGCITLGLSTVDESLLTGESVAVAKQPGDAVASGTLNLDGALQLTATRVGEASTLARIVRLVEESQTGRPPLQRLADRAAGHFVAIVLTLAVLTFGYWWWAVNLDIAVQNAVAVLIITCPCALGLAVPVALITAVGAAAREGILIKQTGALEQMAQIRHVMLDKTGVITAGTPRVVRVCPADGVTGDELLRMAASLESFSEHPLGMAIVQEARARNLVIDSTLTSVHNTPGMGLEGWTADGAQWRVGRPSFVAELTGGMAPEAPADDPQIGAASWAACAANGRWMGWIGLADPLLEDVPYAIRLLHRMGMATQLLSGDRQAVVDAVARAAGVPAWSAGLLPADKVQAIVALQEQGHVVAMVGDGVNDAPAMARANVAIAVARAVDLSASVADVVFLRQDLTLLPRTLRLGQRVVQVIRQNFMLAILYNLLAIPLAASGHVIPLVAAIAMPLSSLAVILNALRLRRREMDQ
jgi:Cu2+-exporting ATPase